MREPDVHLTSNESVVRLRMQAQNSRLVDSRKSKGLTQKMMGLRIGRSGAFVSHVENMRAIPTDDMMHMFARVLDKPVHYLFPSDLILAISRGVFKVRDAELSPSHLVYLTDRANARLLSDGGQGVEDMDRQVERVLLKEAVDKVLNELKPQEREVLELRFGLKDGKTKLRREVGESLGVTAERIQQIEYRALKKLRHPIRSRQLRAYLS